MHSAVLFLVFNRPDTTRKVFEAIRAARPPRLYISADGPRANRPGEAERCAEVRRIATNVDWPCIVKTLFRENNLGCKIGVSSGLDWFFEQEEEGIILEDDCLPHPDFFRFCEWLLKKYRHDTRIMMISGTNLAFNLNQSDAYYFSRYPHIWGWACWRRVWENYDVEMTDLPLLLANQGYINSFKKIAEYRFWADTFQLVRNGTVDTWDAQVVYMAFSMSQLTIYPSKNLIKNIGFNQEAHHTKIQNKWLSDLPTSALSHDATEPKFFIPDFKAERVRKVIEKIGVNPYFRKLTLFLNLMQ